jgi:putative zinc finger protein
MSDYICGWSGDRAETVIGYLYDDIEPAERAAFESHLITCAACRHEVAALGGVRRQLARWAPPDSRQSTVVSHQSGVISHQPGVIERPGLFGAPDRRDARRSWWRDMPAWAQVAAALLVLGVSAGIAGLDVHYDRDGLSVRTGWSKTAPAAPSARAATDSASAAWQSDLAALERQLRTEFRAAQAVAAPASQVQPPARTDADLLRRVKALVDESERRQQSELALRVAEVLRDVNAQRTADLRRIDQNLGAVQDKTNVEVLRNRGLLNYYVQRASQRP